MSPMHILCPRTSPPGNVIRVPRRRRWAEGVSGLLLPNSPSEIAVSLSMKWDSLLPCILDSQL